MRLESKLYHQGKWSVDKYADKFADLITIAGYTDPIAIVVKSCQGLDCTIQDRIAESG